MNTNLIILKEVPIKNKITEIQSYTIKSITLKYYLSWISKLDLNNIEIILGNWDSLIKFRKSTDKVLEDFNPLFI